MYIKFSSKHLKTNIRISRKNVLTVVQEGPGHRVQGYRGPWVQEVREDQVGPHEKDLHGAREGLP